LPPSRRAAEHRPTTLLAELTYRCPLHCPYCSNPLEMSRAEAELSTADWKRVFTEARDLGVLQLGLSGGEPLVRKDLEEMVGHARDAGLYTTLVTSALGLTRQRAERLRAAGIDHVQISFQDTDRESADRIAGIKLGRQKYEAATLVKSMDLAFSVNVVLHRGNLDRIEEIITMAAELGADRIELANTQYYGWAYLNRENLLPTREQLKRAEDVTNRFRERVGNKMRIFFVVPDYYEDRPKACMNGWGALFLTVTADGLALPCHEARMLPGLEFPNVRDHDLRWIWYDSPGFNAYRGDAWMKEPCRTCPDKVKDFGGCRCQAYMLTGDATNTDPVCGLSPHHKLVTDVVDKAQRPVAPAVEVKPLVFRDDRNSRAIGKAHQSGDALSKTTA
jgi:pyrroloquinoline quinone biosynthesis protein E